MAKPKKRKPIPGLSLKNTGAPTPAPPAGVGSSIDSRPIVVLANSIAGLTSEIAITDTILKSDQERLSRMKERLHGLHRDMDKFTH